MMIKATLRLTVEYNVPKGYPKGRAQADIRGLLGYVAEHAADEGLLTDDTEMTVIGWSERTVFEGEE